MKESEGPKPIPARTQAISKEGAYSWKEIGDSFDSMSKIGLALAIGLSAAGLFCRLADQGKVRVPNISSVMLDPTEGKRSDSKS